MITKPKSVEDVSNILKILSDKTRLTMVAILDQQECCVCEFTETFDMSQPAISQHLRKLKDYQIVNETKKGQWVYYSLNKESMNYPMIKGIFEHTPAQDDLIEKLISNSPVRQKCCEEDACK
ncbi:ArsR/SmtB family transcription factor [Gottfriedia solisilvae]|uniref:HTH-type transcriptional repressor AseR n=1 Tax=Gottfriedia solisilvae TaxID=1516104 RepID=A0A8J3AL36_9BACI|nr:metalloregulator ArsR/SmtB family transcription factor [Gottfriedia solisilvae]GGI15623.1 HTH-type transcriptional repressor AseR [Gottfriedia solisilvae]